MILAKPPCLSLLPANPWLPPPSGCLCASLSKLQETEESTCPTLFPGNWIVTSLRRLTHKVAVSHSCHEGRAPSVSSPFVFAAAHRSVQLGGELSPGGDRFKPIPAQNHWHGWQSCQLQSLVRPVSLQRPWSGFGRNVSSASGKALEMRQEHPPGSALRVSPRRSGADGDLLFPC